MANVRLSRRWFRSTGPDASEVVVLLGSLGSDRTIWGRQIPALTDSFNVLHIDHRGHGDSPSYPGPYSLNDLSGDVIEVLDDECVERAHIVGISLGGMIAMDLALRTCARVSSLAVMCSSAKLPPAQSWTARARRVAEEGTSAIADDVVSRWFTAEFAARHPLAVKRMVSMISATSSEGYAGCCQAIAGVDLVPRLAQIQQPLLAIAGRGDRATPAEHLELVASRAANARLEMVPGAHLATVENDVMVNDLLRGHLDAAAERSARGES
ncbi:3-oxoadipate enol-lactonase [Microbacterium sp. MPKO10]|uniref:3-oxoadipate enol-lactonase n=1 Tax=Microbacterium sp. MPKO10 TaxID=2989818 RepID=UPI002235FE07|nr:3-oxoadipate enol-lactonase [Microbacterium sp. MPKO10]MCW4459820.1 3-oxoadipate enol-lactonase [Microbacterium sp. MPKO10]